MKKNGIYFGFAKAISAFAAIGGGCAGLGAEVKQTMSGHAFYSDDTIPEFGDAWRDEEGLIWSELIRGERGWAIRTLHFYAAEHCNKIVSGNKRARLPSVEEYSRLMEKMKKRKGKKCENLTSTQHYESKWVQQEYCPQILPNLDYTVWAADLSENQFGFRQGYRAVFVGASVVDPTVYDYELESGFGAADNRVDEEPFRCVMD